VARLWTGCLETHHRPIPPVPQAERSTGAETPSQAIEVPYFFRRSGTQRTAQRKLAVFKYIQPVSKFLVLSTLPYSHRRLLVIVLLTLFLAFPDLLLLIRFLLLFSQFLLPLLLLSQLRRAKDT